VFLVFFFGFSSSLDFILAWELFLGRCSSRSLPQVRDAIVIFPQPSECLFSTLSSSLVTLSSVFLGTSRVEGEVDGWIARASDSRQQKRKTPVQMRCDWLMSISYDSITWMELNNSAIFTYTLRILSLSVIYLIKWFLFLPSFLIIWYCDFGLKIAPFFHHHDVHDVTKLRHHYDFTPPILCLWPFMFF